MTEVKMVTLGDFLSPSDIRKASQLNDVKEIHDQIIAPQLSDINAKLGQENDPMYLAYMVVYAIEQAGRRCR
jgi:hypothetical protein